MAQVRVVGRSLGIRSLATAATVSAALAVTLTLSAGTAVAAPAKVTVGTVPLHFVGTVDLSSAAVSAARSRVSVFQQGVSLSGAAPSQPPRVVDPSIARLRHAAGAAPASPATPVDTTQVPGESGFSGLNGYQQAAVNHNLDLEPPDQGLCAGNGMVAEFINDSFAVYDRSGSQFLNTLPAYAVFKQPSTAPLSDPRCYYDASTQRWFLTMFIFGNPQGTTPSIQFIAVSNTSDVMGTYSIYSINTTDPNTPGCPCLGDFDQLGVDNNGIYIATNEFSDAIPGPYNGVVMYAMSKQTLETIPNTGIVPVVFRYRLKFDHFGQPYHVSPASTPPGAKFATDTEYFVESNSDAFSGSHLLVYAMLNTSLLAENVPPKLVNTVLPSEIYSFPPPATQKPGPIPLGRANQDPEGVLQADFNAVQEVTYVGGQLYAELSTGRANGTDGVAWFEIAPATTSNSVTATMTNQGYVRVAGQNLLYPVIALNKNGNGYMAFTLSGPRYFPSAAYQTFTPTGPTGNIHVAAPGAVPEDSFTCYPAFVGPDFGGCRWGDYSMGVAMGPNVWLATEYVPPTSRDYLTNWGTFVWRAPAP